MGALRVGRAFRQHEQARDVVARPINSFAMPSHHSGVPMGRRETASRAQRADAASSPRQPIASACSRRTCARSSPSAPQPPRARHIRITDGKSAARAPARRRARTTAPLSRLGATALWGRDQRSHRFASRGNAFSLEELVRATIRARSTVRRTALCPRATRRSHARRTRRLLRAAACSVALRRGAARRSRTIVAPPTSTHRPNLLQDDVSNAPCFRSRRRSSDPFVHASRDGAYAMLTDTMRHARASVGREAGSRAWRERNPDARPHHERAPSPRKRRGGTCAPPSRRSRPPLRRDSM